MNFITTCTVLLVAFVIHSAYGFGVVLKDKDCPGNDVAIIKKSLIDCMNLCNNDRRCIGIVHGVKKRCWMKSKCDDRQDKRRSSIYLKPTVGFRTMKWGSCPPGNDVVIFGEKISITDCMIKCNKNRACIAVTYNRGSCTGKSKCIFTMRNKSAITYFTPRDRGGIPVIPFASCPWPVYNICKKEMQIPLQLCLELCGSYPQCFGIVYSSNTCLLKWSCTRILNQFMFDSAMLRRRRAACDHNCSVKNRKLECSCDEGFALSTKDRRSCIKCHKKIDVVFLLDASGSVKKQFHKEQQFVKDMIDSFIIGENDVQVGLVVFSKKATHVFFLNSHTTKAAMKTAVDSIETPDGKTNMHLGLEFVATQFNATNGQRSGVPNALIVVTDGKFEDGPAAKFRAQELRDADVVIYSVGIANVDVDEVKAIATPPQELDLNYFLTTDFIGLVENVFFAMVETVCTETVRLHIETINKDCGCQHKCSNITGTETCSCNEGFALANDNKSCIGCLKKLDVVFLLDSSGSIIESEWDKEKQFVSKIVESLIIHKNHVNVGLVRFADNADHIFFLNTFLNESKLKTAINKVNHTLGGTNLAQGLEFVQDQFNTTNDVRRKVPNVLVILTDGVANNARAANEKAKELKDKGTTIYSVGVGNIDEEKLKALSSPPLNENFFIADNFDTLVQEVRHVLLENICQA